MLFKKINHTDYPPESKPVMAWDGKCGFCHYWVLKWKLLTGYRVDYIPYQKIHKDYPDIGIRYFNQAIRFIDIDGKVYGGPGAVFQALHRYGEKWRWVMPLYRSVWLFRKLSDLFYSFVSANRSWIYRVVISLLGRNPVRPRPYWAMYLGGLLLISGCLLLIG